MLIMHAHVAQAYGSVRPRTLKGGLTAMQERRAKRLMSTAPYLDLTLAEVARECVFLQAISRGRSGSL